MALNSPSRQVFKTYPGTSLEVHASSAGAVCSIPGRGIKFLHASGAVKGKKKKNPSPPLRKPNRAPPIQ